MQLRFAVASLRRLAAEPPVGLVRTTAHFSRPTSHDPVPDTPISSAMSAVVASSSSSSSTGRTCPTAPRRFQIKVPATSANIGPGFDVVGLSLSLHVVLDVSIDPCVHLAPQPGAWFTLREM